MRSPLGIGVIGCGSISATYFEHLARYEAVQVVACADLVPERAHASAAQYGVPRACTAGELLADPNVDLALNLTVPQAHTEVSLAALAAGKHVYSEKPLALERADGEAILRAATVNRRMAGCAPDTSLGGGIQTCRKLIDEGVIGEPVAASAFFMNHGHEGWHPNPGFYYQKGGGPLFDMGPYYLTALVALLGPVRNVSASQKRTFSERRVASGPLQGEIIPVDVSTHVAGTLEFHNGAVGTMIMSFDVWATESPRIEVYGTEGTLSVPDPNIFGGPVRVQIRQGDWTEVPLAFPEGGRGLGVAEMASALQSGRPSRIDAELANHVLDVMHSVQDSADTGERTQVQTACDRPAAVPLGLPEGVFD